MTQLGLSNISRSALTNGLEWNMKVTTKEVGHIIDKFQKTFATYWQDKEFELFDKTIHTDKLRTALKRNVFLIEIQPLLILILNRFPSRKKY